MCQLASSSIGPGAVSVEVRGAAVVVVVAVVVVTAEEDVAAREAGAAEREEDDCFFCIWRACQALSSLTQSWTKSLKYSGRSRARRRSFSSSRCTFLKN